jgi:D-arabinose 1-dehydrogenase-like Zn-dependent alcohol dehydrogenase
VVLFAEFVDHHVIGAGIIAVCSAVLYVLVLSRLAEVAAALRRALARAQVLRQAGAALAAAATIEQAADAVRSGVGLLLRAHPPEAAVLAVREEGRLRVVGAPSGAPPVSPELPAVVTDNWPSLLAGPAPQMLATGDAAAGDSVLLCPLALQDRPSGDR